METLGFAESLEIVCPGAIYTGSLTDNTEEAYEKIFWNDNRVKPAFSIVQFCSNKPCCISTWNGSGWVTDFTPIRTAKKISLADDCHAAITLSVFQCNALSVNHNYDCRETDQTNARAAYTLALAGSTTKGIMCSDGQRFEIRQHTAEQALLVISAMFDHVESKRAILAQRIGSVEAIDADSYETAEEAIIAINSISW